MPWGWKWRKRSSSTLSWRCASGGRLGSAHGRRRRGRPEYWRKAWGRCTGVHLRMPAACAGFVKSELTVAVGRAAPALAELGAQRFAAVAGPVGAARRFPAKDFFRSSKVLVLHDPDLGLAFGGRQLAHGGGEILVAHQHRDARGLEQVLRVVDELLVVGAEDAFHYAVFSRAMRAAAGGCES